MVNVADTHVYVHAHTWSACEMHAVLDLNASEHAYIYHIVKVSCFFTNTKVILLTQQRLMWVNMDPTGIQHANLFTLNTHETQVDMCSFQPCPGGELKRFDWTQHAWLLLCVIVS